MPPYHFLEQKRNGEYCLMTGQLPKFNITKENTKTCEIGFRRNQCVCDCQKDRQASGRIFGCMRLTRNATGVWGDYLARKRQQWHY